MYTNRYCKDFCTFGTSRCTVLILGVSQEITVLKSKELSYKINKTTSYCYTVRYLHRLSQFNDTTNYHTRLCPLSVCRYVIYLCWLGTSSSFFQTTLHIWRSKAFSPSASSESGHVTLEPPPPGRGGGGGPCE